MDAHVHTVRDAIPDWAPSVTLPEPEPLPPLPFVPAPQTRAEQRRLEHLDRFIARQRRHNLRDVLYAIAMATAVAVTVIGLV
jgi:hypothetical protein